MLISSKDRYLTLTALATILSPEILYGMGDEAGNAWHKRDIPKQLTEEQMLIEAKIAKAAENASIERFSKANEKRLRKALAKDMFLKPTLNTAQPVKGPQGRRP